MAVICYIIAFDKAYLLTLKIIRRYTRAQNIFHRTVCVKSPIYCRLFSLMLNTEVFYIIKYKNFY